MMTHKYIRLPEPASLVNVEDIRGTGLYLIWQILQGQGSLFNMADIRGTDSLDKNRDITSDESLIL